MCNFLTNLNLNSTKLFRNWQISEVYAIRADPKAHVITSEFRNYDFSAFQVKRCTQRQTHAHTDVCTWRLLTCFCKTILHRRLREILLQQILKDVTRPHSVREVGEVEGRGREVKFNSALVLWCDCVSRELLQKVYNRCKTALSSQKRYLEEPELSCYKWTGGILQVFRWSNF